MRAQDGVLVQIIRALANSSIRHRRIVTPLHTTGQTLKEKNRTVPSRYYVTMDDVGLGFGRWGSDEG